MSVKKTKTKKTKADLITQAEFARRRGWTKQYINRLKKEGRLIMVGGLVDDIASKESLEGEVNPLRKNDGTAGTRKAVEVTTPDGGDNENKDSLIHHKKKREKYNAELAQLKYEESIGKLVKKVEVDRDGFAVGRIIRDAIQAIPSRMMDALAAEDNPKKIHIMLEREFDLALEELSKTKIEDTE